MPRLHQHPKSQTLELQSSTFMGYSFANSYVGLFTACTASQSVEIQYLHAVEINGFPIAITVPYANNTVPLKGVTSWSSKDSCSHGMASAATWTALKGSYPENIFPKVTVECGSVQDCVVRYEVAMKCVDIVKTPAPPTTTTQQTELAKSCATPTTTGSYHTKTVLLVASVAAAIIAMRLRA